ncbi:MAG: hypothetical protein JXB04_06100 [Kiritimatiellae bacterium]|nr:hypothetical protein [Kiritimatiellia bacterium]
MRTKSAVMALVFLFSVAWALPVAMAADGQSGSADQVTQAELARILVNVLGLARFLPAAATPMDYFKLLLENKMSPADGWNAEKIVTRADLARVIVQAMQRQNEVENPDDPRSWVNFLRSIGVSTDTIGESTEQVEPMVEPVAANVFVVSTTTDPLKKRKTGEPDETEFGTDVEFVASMRPLSYPVSLPEIEQAVVQVRRHRRDRRPVTEYDYE